MSSLRPAALAAFLLAAAAVAGPAVAQTPQPATDLDPATTVVAKVG